MRRKLRGGGKDSGCLYALAISNPIGVACFRSELERQTCAARLFRRPDSWRDNSAVTSPAANVRPSINDPVNSSYSIQDFSSFYTIDKAGFMRGTATLRLPRICIAQGPR